MKYWKNNSLNEGFIRVQDGSNVDNLLKLCDINDFKLLNYKSYPRIPAEMLAYSN